MRRARPLPPPLTLVRLLLVLLVLLAPGLPPASAQETAPAPEPATRQEPTTGGETTGGETTGGETTGGEATISGLSPGPGDVVLADPLTLTAQVQMPTAALVSVMVEGRVFTSQQVEAGQTVSLSATGSVAPGSQTASVLADGEPLQTWRFTAAASPLEHRPGSDPVTLALDLAGRQSATPRSQAVLVGAEAVPDALAGVPVAAAVGGALLVTAGEALTPALRAGLLDRLTMGGTVHVLGGPAAVDEAVTEELAEMGLRVVRHAGDGRADTAAAVAASVFGTVPTVVVVGEDASADASTASVVAAAVGAPVLLTGRDRLSPATIRHLDDHPPERAILIGGEAVASADVAADLAARGISVERVAGPDRASTAARLSSLVPEAAGGISVSGSGAPIPLLLAAADSAHAGRPLLLSDGGQLPIEVIAAASRRSDGPVVVYGDGVTAAAAAALQTAVGRRSTGLIDIAPGFGAAISPGEAITFRTEEALDLRVEDLGATVDGEAVGVAVTSGSSPSTALVSLQHDLSGRAASAHVFGTLRTASGARIAIDWSGTLQPVVRDYARAAGVALVAPSPRVVLIGYHQSSNPGAINQDPAADAAAPHVVMESRGRGTGRRSSADIVVPTGEAILSPVDGVVELAEDYELYCRYADSRVKLIPDAAPHLRIDILHLQGLQVAAGQRLIAGETVIATSARPLPFDSQVDELVPAEQQSDPPHPHVHLQLVDPSVAPSTPPSPC